jgi:divalent metal cation (Fe/Co/Zn/Cd) transporter
MTDVLTSVGVIAGIGAVALTGLERLDPLYRYSRGWITGAGS